MTEKGETPAGEAAPTAAKSTFADYGRKKPPKGGLAEVAAISIAGHQTSEETGNLG
jgi:hypothetical protein